MQRLLVAAMDMGALRSPAAAMRKGQMPAALATCCVPVRWVMFCIALFAAVSERGMQHVST